MFYLSYPRFHPFLKIDVIMTEWDIGWIVYFSGPNTTYSIVGAGPRHPTFDGVHITSMFCLSFWLYSFTNGRFVQLFYLFDYLSDHS